MLTNRVGREFEKSSSEITEIIIPTAFVTCPVFIRTELLITTANNLRVAEASITRGGDVYKVEVGVTSPSKHKFRYA
jgi:sugar lactone lactonase YvrE